MIRADMFTKWTSASGREVKREREREEGEISLNKWKEGIKRPTTCEENGGMIGKLLANRRKLESKSNNSGWSHACRQADTQMRRCDRAAVSADSVWPACPAQPSRSSRWRSSAGSLWPSAPAAWPAEPCPEERQHTAWSHLLPAATRTPAFLTEGIVFSLIP